MGMCERGLGNEMRGWVAVEKVTFILAHKD